MGKAELVGIARCNVPVSAAWLRSTDSGETSVTSVSSMSSPEKEKLNADILIVLLLMI